MPSLDVSPPCVSRRLQTDIKKSYAAQNARVETTTMPACGYFFTAPPITARCPSELRSSILTVVHVVPLPPQVRGKQGGHHNAKGKGGAQRAVPPRRPPRPHAQFVNDVGAHKAAS